MRLSWGFIGSCEALAGFRVSFSRPLLVDNLHVVGDAREMPAVVRRKVGDCGVKWRTTERPEFRQGEV
ncbi:hypothetical protein MOBUDSM44075_01432 [Mycolicibacterium obuense]|uniref:Uncharacterized protein n=1 Tax=Mycolicibacterium obuense TaxID=1807 RepID=A0A0J6Z2P0_9MYCO|nr:hypothetical protein MOBUDSM44075_01432 [Mycolicibacterium obuense]